MDKQLVLYTGPPVNMERRLVLYTGPVNTETQVEVYTGPERETTGVVPSRPQVNGWWNVTTRQMRAIMPDPEHNRLPYICTRCAATVYLGKKDEVVCPCCDCRSVFKPRTNRIVIHDGR